MAAVNKSRDEIIRRGAELIHRKGYHATGLQEILKEARVPKGSFYFYFRSKEDFGAAVIDYFTETLGAVFSLCLNDRSLSPPERLERLFVLIEEGYRKNGYTLGCPIGNLALEMADNSDPLRDRLRAAIDKLLTSLESCLQEGRADGSLPPHTDPSETARFIFQGLEGALLHMKVCRSAEPLRIFRKFLLEYLSVSLSGKKAKKHRG